LPTSLEITVERNTPTQKKDKGQAPLHILLFQINLSNRLNLPKMEAKNTLVDSSGQQLLNEIKIDSYFEILLFTCQDFLRWWYIKMPMWHLRRFARLSVVVDDQFSISLLIRHFFLPWHRDYSLIGYVFGIAMKLLYLPIAITIYLLCMTIYLIVSLSWLVLPIGALVFVIISFF
jgi:hypothetical protein